jgi:hypothetical protein
MDAILCGDPIFFCGIIVAAAAAAVVVVVVEKKCKGVWD